MSQLLETGWQQARAGKLTPAEFALLVEHDAIPQLHAVRTRVQSFRRVPRDQRQLADRMGDYLRLREESLQLLAEAIREDSPERMEQSKARNEAALKVVGVPPKRSP